MEIFTRITDTDGLQRQTSIELRSDVGCTVEDVMTHIGAAMTAAGFSPHSVRDYALDLASEENDQSNREAFSLLARAASALGESERESDRELANDINAYLTGGGEPWCRDEA